MNRKKIIFSILLTALILSVYFYFFRSNEGSAVTKIVQKKERKGKSTSTESKKEIEKITKNENLQSQNFSDNNLSQIQKCISSYSSSSSEDLKGIAFPPGSEILFSKKNIHFKSNSGVIYQKRSEGSPSEQKEYYFKIEHDLPIRISENEFNNETKEAEVIYKESTKRSNTSEVISIDEKIIKIEINSSAFSLSCDYMENEWECFCFKEN